MTRGRLTVVGMIAALFVVSVLDGAPGAAGVGQSRATPAVTTGDWTAHLFDGACGAPHPAARFELAPLAPDGIAGTASATPADVATAVTPRPVNDGQPLTSITTLDVPLSNLVAAPSAIDVHRPGSPFDESLVCGEVRGAPSDGNLFVLLTTAGGAGFVGSAWLHATPDDRTVIAITVISAQSLCPVGNAATPEAVASPATLVDALVIADELDIGITPRCETPRSLGQDFVSGARRRSRP